MTRTNARFALLAAASLALSVTAGCDLTETCDPVLDPNCTFIDVDGGTDASTDTSTGTGCGALGEGQSRCVSANTMELCQGGNLQTTTCDGECANNACQDAIRYVRIIDATATISGQHPGADIDAIALESNGQTTYAQQVTDSFIPSDVPNLANVVTEVLGPPDVGPNECDLEDGHEHWTSLAGGDIVVGFGKPIRPGDRITVYECAGSAQDAFHVTIGVSDRLDGDWDPILENATGTISVTVPAN